MSSQLLLKQIKNYENIGNNRQCLHGEQRAHQFTDQWFKKVLPEIPNIGILLLSIEYVIFNPELKEILFGKITETIKSDLKNNVIKCSSKQLRILYNFIYQDLKSLRCDFLPLHRSTDLMKKVFEWNKCFQNQHNNVVPEINTYFSQYLE